MVIKIDLFSYFYDKHTCHVKWTLQMKIGERLKFERERLGFSQAAFARFLGITRQALGPIEEGGVFKTSVLEVAATLGVDVQFVVTGVRSSNHQAVQNQVAIDKQVITGPVSGVGFALAGSTVINTHRHETKIVAQTTPGKMHITEVQRGTLHQLVDKVVQAEAALRKAPKTHRAVWAALNRHCGVSSYQLIALGDFDKAEKFLRQWLGRLHASPTAHRKVGSDLRKQRYSYIKVNSKSPEDSAALQRHLKAKYGVESISDLSNEDLERVYRFVAGLKRR